MKKFGLTRSAIMIMSLGFTICASESAEAYNNGSWGSTGSVPVTVSWGSSGGLASNGGFASAGFYGSSGGYQRQPFRPIRNFVSEVHRVHQRRWGGSSGGFASSGGHSSGGSSGGYGVSSGMNDLRPMSLGGAASSETTPVPQAKESVITGSNDAVDDADVPDAVPAAVPNPAKPLPAASEGFGLPPMPSPAAGDNTRYRPAGQRDAVLKIDLPMEAKVWINGQETTTVGSLRSFVSRNLEPDKDYKFAIKAVVSKDGRDIAMRRKVTLKAGVTKSVKFDFEQPQLTQLLLKVPKDAVVTLSGNQTAAKGEVRYFKSRTLKPGESWADYRVTVSVVRDGKTLVAEKSLKIESGEQYVLAFDLDQADLYVSK
ncbi:MAG: TIGR03000 domain-containing protein [Mariniblastus sp.]|nr:TIGR03000 domain-containing protein [Mariniblastus sp.]